jgi:hypothetical protein
MEENLSSVFGEGVGGGGAASHTEDQLRAVHCTKKELLFIGRPGRSRFCGLAIASELGLPRKT